MSIFYARVGITCRPCTMLYWIPIIQKWARCRNLRYTDSSLLNLSFVCPNETFPTFGIVPFKRLNENELIASFQRWNGKNINISFKRLNGPIPNIGLSPFKRLNGLSPKIGEGPFKRLNGETCMTFWHDAHEKIFKKLSLIGFASCNSVTCRHILLSQRVEEKIYTYEKMKKEE